MLRDIQSKMTDNTRDIYDLATRVETVANMLLGYEPEAPMRVEEAKTPESLLYQMDENANQQAAVISRLRHQINRLDAIFDSGPKNSIGLTTAAAQGSARYAC